MHTPRQAFNHGGPLGSLAALRRSGRGGSWWSLKTQLPFLLHKRKKVSFQLLPASTTNRGSPIETPHWMALHLLQGALQPLVRRRAHTGTTCPSHASSKAFTGSASARTSCAKRLRRDFRRFVPRRPDLRQMKSINFAESLSLLLETPSVWTIKLQARGSVSRNLQPDWASVQRA